GELVDAELANEAPYRGDARILLNLENGAALLILRQEFELQLLGVGHHRAELEHRESAPVHAHAFLLEEDGPARGDLDGERREHHEGGEDPEREGRSGDVEEALDDHLERLVLDVEEVHIAIAEATAIDRAGPAQAKSIGRKGEGQTEPLADA